jgi:hypothetical protein
VAHEEATLARLEPEQEDVLERVCEAARRDRSPFLALRTMGGSWLDHPGLTDKSLSEWSDLDVLARYGLIQVLKRQSASRGFIVTPKGLDYWRALQQEKGGPIERIEARMRRLFDARPTSGADAPAFDKWAEAEALLWGAEQSPGQLTTVGHLCREAMQQFAVAFVSELGLSVDAPVGHTVDRIRTGLAHLRDRLPRSWSRCSTLCSPTGAPSPFLCSGRSTTRRRKASRSAGRTPGSS